MTSPLMSQSEALEHLGIDKPALRKLLLAGRIVRGEYGNFVRADVERLAMDLAQAIILTAPKPNQGKYRTKPQLSI